MTTRLLKRGARFGRALWRISRLAATALCAAASLVLNPRHRRDPLARARWLGATCGAALRALAVDVKSRGTPPTNSVIVANHLGYIDVLALAALSPVVFVAKREVAGWPVLGWFARMAGTRFIDRKNRSDVIRVGEEFGPTLAAGANVVVFLEATSSDGKNVLPFKSSLLEPVVQRQWSIAPAAIAFKVPEGFSASEQVCWWGGATLVPHFLKLVTIPRIEAMVLWGAASVAAGDRKQLAVALREQVVKLHTTLTTPGANELRRSDRSNFVEVPV